jgi:hypothetical protein
MLIYLENKGKPRKPTFRKNETIKTPKKKNSNKNLETELNQLDASKTFPKPMKTNTSYPLLGWSA